MGLRGPPPTPTRVLQLRGTYRPDRHADPSAEPSSAPLKALPPCPAVLGAAGKLEWARVGAWLVANEMLSEPDLSMFATYGPPRAPSGFSIGGGGRPTPVLWTPITVTGYLAAAWAVYRFGHTR
jgi:hypothetical protein